MKTPAVALKDKLKDLLERTDKLSESDQKLKKDVEEFREKVTQIETELGWWRGWHNKWRPNLHTILQSRGVL